MPPTYFDNGVTVYPPKPGAREQRHRVTYYVDGARKHKWRVNPGDARQVALQLAAQPGNPATNIDTITDLVEHYLHPANRNQWSANYTASRTSLLAKWVLPEVGHLHPADTTRGHWQQVLAGAQTGGLKQSSVRCVLAACRGLIAHGIAHGVLTVDPLTNVRIGRRQGSQSQSVLWVAPHMYPSQQAVERLAAEWSAATVPDNGLMVRVAAYTGLRAGELHELRVADVDLNTGVIAVRRQHGVTGSVQHLHLPKGNKVRETFLPDFLADSVATHIAGLRGAPAAANGCEDGCPDAISPPVSPLLFGAHMPSGQWQPSAHRRSWQRVRAAAGWPVAWTWHGLRHHFCTWALAAPGGDPVNGAPSGLGLEPADVAHLAGHTTPEFTYRAYVRARVGTIDRARRASGGTE